MFNKSAFPPPADTRAAERLRADFAARGAAEREVSETPTGAVLLAALSNAPFLAELACRDSVALLALFATGPDAHSTAILDRLRALPATTPRAALGAALRRAKREMALAVAVADIGGLWTLEQVTGALSDLAEIALEAAVAHMLLALHQQGKITLPYPETPTRECGFVALGLGKLGAHELNYSSDIDLVLIYDPDLPIYGEESRSLMARLARDLTTLLSARDEHGYVFRVDLRLRPDPSATPPVVSLSMALSYYEAHGRTWERAAFSKARPVAGDLALGAQFLAAIRPFIWRKYLDFAAVADIQEMKHMIDAQAGSAGLLERDVKRGVGGIREIEFIVQTLELVWGGQSPGLRIPATLQALPVLVRAGHLSQATAGQLARDYRELRRVEHRLQMVADRQTHELPSTDEALDSFTVFLGTPDFRTRFPRLLARVHGHFRSFFSAGASNPHEALHPGHEGPPPVAFAAHLHALGFKDDKHITERLRDWRGGRLPALRAERARALLEDLMPPLLDALAAQPDPDKAFAHFDALLSKQRAGVQLLSLFVRNTALLKRLAAVLGASPVLAEHLEQDAQALEALLVPTARFTAPRPALRRLLEDATDLEQAVAITRRFVRREEFHLSVATLEGRVDVDQAGRLRTALAEAALSLLLPRVLAAHKARFGAVRGGRFAVVALGKAGSGEMLAGSDLDLLLIYDHAPAEIAPTPYFVRLSHAFTAALTAQGPEGPLYKVDTRLRPSGNSGPAAVSLAAFARYHVEESWTWERLALTRARVLAATPGFAAKVQAAIAVALCRPDSEEKILTDTAAMRERLARDLPPRGPFDVKALPGGLMEVAFIAEALQLLHGPRDPALFQPNTAAALRALTEAGHLPRAEGEALVAAEHFWRTVQGINRVTGLSDRATQPPAALLAPLLRATGTLDLDDLHAHMEKTAQTVRACFTRIIQKGRQA